MSVQKPVTLIIINPIQKTSYIRMNLYIPEK